MKVITITATVMLAAISAGAQEPAACKTNETILDCWNRMHNAYVSQAIRETTQGEPTSPIDPALGKSIKDFLPRFASGFSANTDKKNVTALQYNTLPLHIPILGRGRVQIGGVINPAEPYKALIDTVAKAQRAAATKDIADNLRDIDDLDFSFGWNWETRHLGRSFSSQRRALTKVLVAGTLRDVSQQKLAPIYREMIRNHTNAPSCSNPDDVGKWSMGCIPDSSRVEAQDRIRESAKDAAYAEVRARTDLNESQIFTVPFLINNQPQAHLNLGYHRTTRFVGPQQAYGEITYEFGQYNMETLTAYCDSVNKTEEITPSCLRSYILRPDVRAGLRNGNRYSLTLGATRYLEYSAALPQYNRSITEPASWQYHAKAAWGRFFGVPDAGTAAAKGRLESSFEYLHHTNTNFRNKNRVLGTISYTHRVNDDVSLTTGFVVANKAEVRGDVNWPLGVQAGFKYKFSGGDSK